MASPLKLTDEELAFFRLTCDLFPTPESPLRFVHDEDLEPEDTEQTFRSLEKRGLLNGDGSGASDEVRQQIDPVSECSARVTFRAGSTGGGRCFYLSDGAGVEYSHDQGVHCFGEPLTEAKLAGMLAASFSTSATIQTRPLRMSASDYLVFAVFARDVRAQPDLNDDAPMSVAEVLAYFGEPETKYVPTPSDNSWQSSVKTLHAGGVLVQKPDGYELDASLRPLARQLVADDQRTVLRLDFLDEEWLVREVNLYPTADSVFRLGTQPDGSVIIEELSSEALTGVLERVVTTLPDILSPDIPAMLKGSELHARGRL